MEEEKHEFDIDINATRAQIEEFKESVLWRDMQQEILVWYKMAESEMKAITDNAKDENPSTASVLLHMGDANGRMKAVIHMLDLPNLLLDNLKEKSNDRQTKELNQSEVQDE